MTKNKTGKANPSTLDELLRLSEADRMSPNPPQEVRRKNGVADETQKAEAHSSVSDETSRAGAASSEAAEPLAPSPAPDPSEDRFSSEKEEAQRAQRRVEIRQSEVRRGITDTVGMKVSEYEKLVAESDFLRSLVQYEDKYIARRQKYERKCVLIDAEIFNTLDRVSFYRMCKSNMINAILKYAIHEHREELVNFLKNGNYLL